MSIFNSLGSNYSGKFVWDSIIIPGSKHKVSEIRQKIAKRYQGSVTLTYKGRQALELALENSGLAKGSAVGLNGFTCYVLYQAVERAGYQPVLIDIAAGKLNFGDEELKSANGNTKKLEAIIVQNTLGMVADMAALESYCKKHNIMIIEDLAHSVGAIYADGREAGTVGQLTMLSFSQDKPLDVVAGGALVDRREDSKNIVEQPKLRVTPIQREINALYPFWTVLIRGLYPIGLGRYLHFGLKKLHLLATPMSDNLAGIYTMEPSAARLLLKRWQMEAHELSHRQTVADIYKKALPSKIQIKPEPKSRSVYLRFPLLVDDRAALLAYLKSKSIYIGDTWYDAPIAPKRYLSQTNYQEGDCPNAETLAGHIVNLPTHIHVSEQQAQMIAEEVNKWLQLQ